MNSNTNKAFTLVEVMVTVAIIAVLTAIAAPQYSQYRSKEIRSDAVRSMLKLSLELERCRSRNGDGSYTQCLNNQAQNSIQNHYNLNVAFANNATEFTITAVKTGTVDSECSSYTLTHDGLRDSNTNNSGLNSVKKRIQRCWAN